jgi:hypothetical protein
MSEAHATPRSTQVAMARRPEQLDVRAEAGASNLQNSSAIVRTRPARLFGNSRVEDVRSRRERVANAH